MRTRRSTLARAVALAAIAVTLGGCQMLGLGGRGLADRAAPEDLAEAPAVDLGADRLAAGREALAAGRTVEAIEAFMLAKAFPQQMPAAYNGLAVAYSRLGRADLTERFFLTAVALAPEEERYRANLARFYAASAPPKLAEPVPAPAVATAHVAREVAAVAAPEPAVRTLAGGVTVRSAGTSLQRISRGEVAIRSGRATAPAVQTAAAARRPVIEVGAPRAAAYPVRVTLSDPRPARGAQPSYPIRVPLAD